MDSVPGTQVLVSNKCGRCLLLNRRQSKSRAPLETSIVVPAMTAAVVFQGTAEMRVPFASKMLKDGNNHY